MTSVLSRLRRRQLTVRGWQFLVLLSMGLLVLAGAVTGATLLTRTDDVTREMTNNIQPARVAAADLQAALRDQETGLRGYLISADRQFLAPYYDGTARRTGSGRRGPAANRLPAAPDR